MERTTPQSIGDVLRNLFQENCMQDRLNERKAIALWPKVVGQHIGSLSKAYGVKNGIMTVGVENSSLRQELHMNRSTILRTINLEIGEETIKDIRFVS